MLDRFGRALVVAALVASMLVACRTTDIGPPTEVSVPSNLSRSDAEAVIAAMLVAGNGGKQARRNPTIQEIVVTSAVGAALLEAFRGQSSKGWFIESWEKGQIEAGFQHRSHYLRVSMMATDTEVSLRIADSRNLNQRNGRIHENALVWRDRLALDIREALGRASVMKRGSG